MYNAIRPELALSLHRERVSQGLRRAARASGQPLGPGRRPRRRFQLRLRMA
jgi:hypothetical protein